MIKLRFIGLLNGGRSFGRKYFFFREIEWGKKMMTFKGFLRKSAGNQKAAVRALERFARARGPDQTSSFLCKVILNTLMPEAME